MSGEHRTLQLKVGSAAAAQCPNIKYSGSVEISIIDIINAQGLCPHPDKVLAIQEAPTPHLVEIVPRSALVLWEVSPKFVHSTRPTV